MVVETLLKSGELGVDTVKTLVQRVADSILGLFCPVVDVESPLGRLLVEERLDLVLCPRLGVGRNNDVATGQATNITYKM